MIQYKSILLFVALALCALVFIADGHAKEPDTLSSQAMLKFLSWEKFWYGEFFGEDCYNKLVGENIRIAIQQKIDSEVVQAFRCDEKKGQIAKQKTFDAYIANTNFLFHGVWLGDKPVAEIAMGSAPPGCNIDDLEPRVTNLLKDARTTFINVTLPPIAPYQLSTIEENLKDHVILAVVKRSMASFINYYYFESAPFGESQRKALPELLEKIKHSNRILLARFNSADPFLLVYYEGDGRVYLLRFPSRKILNEKNICMQVSSADPYWGEVSDSVREKVMSYLLTKIKKNSIELKIEMNKGSK